MIREKRPRNTELIVAQSIHRKELVFTWTSQKACDNGFLCFSASLAQSFLELINSSLKGINNSSRRQGENNAVATP